MQRIISEIPGPTFGYLRRSAIEYREGEDALRGNVIEGDLRILVYVDGFRQNDIEWTSMCRKVLCKSRYRMRYARGCGPFGDLCAILSDLLIDKVSIQKEILAGKLRSIESPNGDREEIQQKLDFAKNRWGGVREISERNWPNQEAAINFDGMDSAPVSLKARVVRVEIGGS